MGAGDYDQSWPSWHRKMEEKLKGARMTWTILRPKSFNQNVVALFAQTIRSQGVFYSSMRDAKNSFLDVRDIAVVAAKALAGGEHAGKTYELNGPEALSYSDVEEKISKHAGRKVQYVDIPVDAQGKAMLDQGMPAWQVDALLDLQGYYMSGKGGAVDPLLQNLLGRSPITMDRFLSEFAGDVRIPAASA